jgi:hypothetical protein
MTLFAVAGVALASLYIDSHQQDGGYHYLFARWAWTHPDLFVGVWARPLFTFLYSFPALLGYPAAKLFTVAVCLATAWQTWRIAIDLKLERPELAIPFLFLQPSYLLLCSDTLTEPIFALVFVIALRLHLRGYVKTGMLVASAMILARPEGFFLGALWGVWVLFDRRDNRPVWQRIPATLLLATGALVWWLAALLITRDPLFIKSNWPPDWKATGAVYGSGELWSYVLRLPEIAGPLLLVPFLVGLVVLVLRRRMGTITSAFLVLLVVHSVLRAFGMFGSAGYPRYFVCVSPAIALISLAGWNAIAAKLSNVNSVARSALAALVLMVSFVLGLLYIDGAAWSRDARAVSEMYSWFRLNPRPFRQLIWSQAYMCIVFDRDPREQPQLSSEAGPTLEILRQSPHGTLVFWDGQTGPAWHGVTADDIEAAGFVRLRSRSYTLDGLFLNSSWFGYGGPRQQEMHVLYKE